MHERAPTKQTSHYKVMQMQFLEKGIMPQESTKSRQAMQQRSATTDSFQHLGSSAAGMISQSYYNNYLN